MSGFADLANEIDVGEPDKQESFNDLASQVAQHTIQAENTKPAEKGYFQKVYDAAKKFNDSGSGVGDTVKAVGENALGMVTQAPLGLLKHGIEEGAYLSGQDPQQAANTAQRVLPIGGYQPTSDTGKALSELISTTGQPLVDAGKWAAEKVGLSPAAQNIAGDFAPVVIPKVISAAPNAIKGVVQTGQDVVGAANRGLTDVNAKFQELQRIGRGEAAPEAAPIAEAPKEINATSFNSDLAPTAKIVPPEAQASRAEILRRIGIPEDANIRQSAITGDAKMAKTDYQQSLVDNPAGDLLSQTIANERQYLTNHAENIIKNTGASVGNDGSALYARGVTQLTPLTELGDLFDKKIGDLYKAADERAQGQPVTLNKFNEVLNGAENLTNSDRVHLQAATNSYIKKLGLDSENGIAGNVQQAETIRKYLNENWSPQSNGFIKSLKNALDDDVTSAAGEDIYSAARALRQQRGALLDNPKGVAKLMDSNGPNGINRAVDIEKIPQQIKSMPVDQFSHILDTLENVPDEIKPAAQQALAEIRGQFANDILDIGNKFKGQWNEKGVTEYLKTNSEKLNRAFADNPEQLQAFKDLNDAGHILKIDKAYPGAAIQSNNMVKRGALTSLGPAAATAGGAIGAALPIPGGAAIGTAIGGYAGNAAAKSMLEKSALKGAESRMTKLSDIGKKP